MRALSFLLKACVLAIIHADLGIAGEAGELVGNNDVEQAMLYGKLVLTQRLNGNLVNEGIRGAFVSLTEIDGGSKHRKGAVQTPSIFVSNGTVSPESLAIACGDQVSIFNIGNAPEIFTIKASNYSLTPGMHTTLSFLRPMSVPYVVTHGTMTNTCEIFVHSNDFVACSSTDGAFAIKNVPRGRWLLKVCLRQSGTPRTIDLSRSSWLTIDEDGIQVAIFGDSINVGLIGADGASR